MTTLEKINRCHDILVESNKRIGAQLNKIEAHNRDSFYKKEDCYTRVVQINAARNRVINYMRTQAMNLIVELGS